jgi:hypothetical protein
MTKHHQVCGHQSAEALVLFRLTTISVPAIAIPLRVIRVTRAFSSEARASVPPQSAAVALEQVWTSSSWVQKKPT